MTEEYLKALKCIIDGVEAFESCSYSASCIKCSFFELWNCGILHDTKRYAEDKGTCDEYDFRYHDIRLTPILREYYNDCIREFIES